MRHRFGMLGGLLALALLVGCGKDEPETSAAQGGFESSWASEEHWMVSNVVNDLQGMAKLAGVEIPGGKVTFGKAVHEFQIGSTTLDMKPSCWDVASYTPLLASWNSSRTTEPNQDSGLLHDLLTPTAKVLQKANLETSSRIKASPSDPQVHEDAALLLGVFGMREFARQFNDLRPLVCRMTAHLAVARQLRSGTEASVAGQWAEVLFDLHAGRPVKAMELAGKIPQDGDSGRWKRVVEMLITGDWRRAGDLSDPTLAETIAQCRALKEHRGNPVMLEVASEREDFQAIPEWSRELAASGRSVEEGHLAMRSVLHMEFLEMAEVFPVGKDPSPEKVAKFIAAESKLSLVSGDGEIRVISDGDWASYFRRHLFAACADIAGFTIRQWGSDEAAVEWEKSVLPYCRSLPAHELIEPLVATKVSNFQSGLKKTAEYIRKHPEQVPMGLWFDYRFPTLETSSETEMPDQVPWFREVSPPETAFDPRRRIRFTGIQGADWVKHIAALHVINPWDSVLSFELAENTGNSVESIEKSWGSLREYSIRPLRQILTVPSIPPEKHLETLRTLSEFKPEEGLELGYILAALDRPEEAIQAYEEAFKDSTDRVSVSNQTQWMIYYYKSKGMDAKAREIAHHNAEVYSQRGLASALALAVAEKDGPKAKNLAMAINERYGDSSYLVAAAWDGGTNPKSIKSVFPEGLKEVTLSDFSSVAQVKGVRLSDTKRPESMSGMKTGDIIFAIDGKRVESKKQLSLLLNTGLAPKVKIIYRRGKTAAEADCLMPDRHFGSKLYDYGK